MGLVGAGFEFRVELHAHVEGPLAQLHGLHQMAVRGQTGEGQAAVGKHIPIVVVELIAVAVMRLLP